MKNKNKKEVAISPMNFALEVVATKTGAVEEVLVVENKPPDSPRLVFLRSMATVAAQELAVDAELGRSRKTLKKKYHVEVLEGIIRSRWIFPSMMYPALKQLAVVDVDSGGIGITLTDVNDMNDELWIVAVDRTYTYVITPQEIYVLDCPEQAYSRGVPQPAGDNRVMTVTASRLDTLLLKEDDEDEVEDENDDEGVLTVSVYNVGYTYSVENETLIVYRSDNSAVWVAIDAVSGRAKVVRVESLPSPRTARLMTESVFVPVSSTKKSPSEENYDGGHRALLAHKSLSYARAVGGGEEGYDAPITHNIISRDEILNRFLDESLAPFSPSFVRPVYFTHDRMWDETAAGGSAICRHPACDAKAFVAVDSSDMTTSPACFHSQIRGARSFVSTDNADRFPVLTAKFDNAVETERESTPTEYDDNVIHHLPYSLYPGQTDVYETMTDTRTGAKVSRQTGFLVTGTERRHHLSELFYGRLSSTARSTIDGGIGVGGQKKDAVLWSRVTLLGVSDAERNAGHSRHTVWRIIPRSTCLLGFDRDATNACYRLTRLLSLDAPLVR